MSRLKWDGERNYETGVDRGVLYLPTGEALSWNGLTAVNEELETLNQKVRYRDGLKYLNKTTDASFAAEVEAFTYPEALDRIRASMLGFTYRTTTANGYKIHLVYNPLFRASNREYAQEDNSSFKFSLTTRPVPIPSAKPCAHLIIDSSNIRPGSLETLEGIVYGSEEAESRFPSPSEVFDIFEVNATLKVTDHGDGSFTVEGPDDAISVSPDGSFVITWPSAIFVSSDTYTIRSF